VSDVIDIRQFLRHGLLPEGPLQPPEGKPQPRPRELTKEQKLVLIREMAAHAEWRAAVMEAIPESDTYDWFLSAVLWGSDKEAGDWARTAIIEHIEGTLKQRAETWEDYL